MLYYYTELITALGNSWPYPVPAQTVQAFSEMVLQSILKYVSDFLEPLRENPYVNFLVVLRSFLTLISLFIFLFQVPIVRILLKVFWYDVIDAIRSFMNHQRKLISNKSAEFNPYWAQYLNVFNQRRVSWLTLIQLVGQILWYFLPRMVNSHKPLNLFVVDSIRLQYAINSLGVLLGLVIGYYSFRMLLHTNYYLIVKEEKNVKDDPRLLEEENFTSLFLQSASRLASCAFIWNVCTKYVTLLIVTGSLLLGLSDNILAEGNLLEMLPGKFLLAIEMCSYMYMGTKFITVAMFADYVLSWSVISKTADVIGDQIDSKNLTHLDKLGDVMADATFTPLTLITLSNYIFKVTSNGPLLYILSYLGFVRILGWVSNRVRTVDSWVKTSFFNPLLLYSLCAFGALPTILLKVSLSLTDLKFMSFVSRLVNFDSGFISLLPIMIIPIVELTFLLLGSRSPEQFFNLITLLAVFDQVGYLFDKFDREEQDMIGNQTKACFKWIILWTNKLCYASFLWISYQGCQFYSHLERLNEEIKLGKVNREKLSPSDINYQNLLWHDLRSISLKTALTSASVPVAWLVLTGGTLDNLKKSYELKKLSGEKDTLKKVQNMDLLGDFLKDVLYPATIAFSTVEFTTVSEILNVSLLTLARIVRSLLS